MTGKKNHISFSNDYNQSFILNDDFIRLKPLKSNSEISLLSRLFKFRLILNVTKISKFKIPSLNEIKILN